MQKILWQRARVARSRPMRDRSAHILMHALDKELQLYELAAQLAGVRTGEDAQRDMCEVAAKPPGPPMPSDLSDEPQRTVCTASSGHDTNACTVDACCWEVEQCCHPSRSLVSLPTCLLAHTRRV